MEGVFSSTFLNPTALFGLHGMDRWTHSLFWGMLLKPAVFRRQSRSSRGRPTKIRASHHLRGLLSPKQFSSTHRPANIEAIEDVLGQYLGPVSTWRS